METTKESMANARILRPTASFSVPILPLSILSQISLFYTRVRTLGRKKIYSRVFKLRCIKDFVRVVIVWDEDGEGKPVFYATSYCSLKAEDILRYYGMRWSIDLFHRDAKQHLGLAEWKVRSLEGAVRHWHLLMLAYSLLRLGSASQEVLRGFFREGKSIGRAARYFSFLAFIELMWLVVEKGVSPLIAEFIRNGGLRMG
jgi:hypothetical protein